MTEIPAGLIKAHRNNLERYCRLLATNLTDLERDYIHRRIAETQQELDRLNVTQIEENLYDAAAHPRIGRRRPHIALRDSPWEPSQRTERLRIV
jgi:hypothetical protein